MKPLIGLTCNNGINASSMSSVATPHMPQVFNQISDNYIKAIENNGGIPVVIPVYDNQEDLLDLISRLDGIVFTGGPDIGPHHYGEFPSKNLGPISNDRDVQELFLVNYVIDKTDLPVLGICRGLQMLNVARGGTLYQDLCECGLNRHNINAYPRYLPSHKDSVVEGTKLHSIINSCEIGVNSYHHQAVKDVAPGFKVVAKSQDGIIEALEPEKDTGRFIMGLQWHPEALQDYAEHKDIVKAFVEAASK